MGAFEGILMWIFLFSSHLSVEAKGGFGGGGRGFSGARFSARGGGKFGGSVAKVRFGSVGVHSRHSSSFGSGTTFFWLGGFHIGRSGYAYECREPNSTVITRCREKNTIFADEGHGSPERYDDINYAVFKQLGYVYDDNGTHVVSDLTVPLIWDNRSYYWNKTLYEEDADADNKTICVLSIAMDDKGHFKSFLLEDTMETPSELAWGCPVNEFCCGYACCSPVNKDVTGDWAVCVVMMFVCAYIRAKMEICCETKGKERAERARAENETEMRTLVVQPGPLPPMAAPSNMTDDPPTYTSSQKDHNIQLV